MLSTPTEQASLTPLQQKWMGALIWLAFAAIGIGVLYVFSLLSGD
jgi:hypothetical protein